MSSSLQEQLLKAGLVTEEQVEEARRKEARGRQGSGARARQGQGRGRGEGKGAADASRDDKGRGKPRPKPRRARQGGEPRGGQRQGQAPSAEGATSPGPRRSAPLDKKRLRQRVRALLEKRAQNVENGEIPYNFVRGKRVKRLYLDESLRNRLVGGELLIAEVYGLHHVLDEKALAALLELLPETFVHRHGDASESASPGAGESDEYAGFEVPDDLVW